MLLAAGHLRGRTARVLDACAAPGGKAFHLAELLGPGSEVVAVELHPRKAEALRQEARRRGLPVHGDLRRRLEAAARRSRRAASTRCWSTPPAPGSARCGATPS